MPKKEGVNKISDYGPISLLHGIYKILVKTLSIRLATVVEGLILYFQTSSIKGRLIQDIILMANELIDSGVRSKNLGLIFKLDFSKAFDSVSWYYHDYMITRFGFGIRWRT